MPSRRARTSLSAWREAGALWSFRGHSVFARVAGPAEAPALLLIHGFPTASWDWEAMLKPLAQNHRVFAADMMGFGFSEKPAEYSYSTAAQADLQEALLLHHGVKAFVALSHDYGDTVAQEILARQNEAGSRPAMRGLALLNGGLFPETHRPLFMQRLLLSPLGPILARLTTRETLARSLRGIFGPATQPDDEFIDGAWELMTHHDGRLVLPRLIRYMIERTVHRERWVGALQRATIPLKLICGAADPISGRHMADRYRELVPHPDITLIDGIGHYPQWESPDEVLNAFKAWAAGVSWSAAARPSR